MALAGQWGGSEGDSVQGGFAEAAQAEMETPPVGLCFFVSLLLQPLHSREQVFSTNWDSPKVMNTVI